MSNKKPKPNEKMQEWIDARKRHHLSHAQVQMARELGMNPKKLGKIDNHKQEPWKMPLPQFIEYLYEKRFGKERPDVVLTTGEMVQRDAEKKLRKREVKLQRRQAEAAGQLPRALPSETATVAEQGQDELSTLQ
jgi:hypothetical protein